MPATSAAAVTEHEMGLFTSAPVEGHITLHWHGLSQAYDICQDVQSLHSTL